MKKIFSASLSIFLQFPSWQTQYFCHFGGNLQLLMDPQIRNPIPFRETFLYCEWPPEVKGIDTGESEWMWSFFNKIIVNSLFCLPPLHQGMSTFILQCKGNLGWISCFWWHDVSENYILKFTRVEPSEKKRNESGTRWESFVYAE